VVRRREPRRSSSASVDEQGGSSIFAPPICRGDDGTTLFRSVSSEEDGGNPANIAASGASNQAQRDARAASEKQAGVTEFVPEIVLGNGRVVRVLGQLGAGDGLDQQQV